MRFDLPTESCFNNPGNTPLTAHAMPLSVDEAFLNYYETQNGRPEFVLIRAVNVQMAGWNNTEYHGQRPDGSYFVRWGRVDLPLDPSAVCEMRMLSGWLGWAARDFDIMDLHRAVDPRIPERAPIDPGIVVHRPAAAAVPAHHPVAVPAVNLATAVQDAIDGLLGQYRATAAYQDPQRPGNGYTSAEVNVAGAIMQLTPNTQAAYLAGLNRVFSPARSQKLLDDIANGDAMVE